MMKTVLRWLGWIVLVAALSLPLLYLTGQFKIEVTNADPRPRGGVYEIDTLDKRDDVNVLFILTDTLRSHRLSAYGYERETSPTFDYMATTGVRFARHLAQSSWTKCSMASFWTGLYPQRTGVLRSSHAVPEEATTPAEIFKDAGFRTAGIWRNGWVAPNFGFGQGFEVYNRPAPTPLGGNLRIENPHIKLEGTDHDSVSAALEFLRVHGKERWFMYLHLMDVHQYLYDIDNAVFGTTYSDIYDNSIRHTDEIIGKMLTYLVEQDLLENTLVILSSDHGEAFGERGIEGHAREVFRETTEVPFVIGFPFQLEKPVVVETRSRNVDVWPTILDLLGLPELPDTDGRSLVPEMLAAAMDRPMEDEIPAFAHLDRSWGQSDTPSAPAVQVARGNYRYHYRLSAEEEDGSPGKLHETLYDSKEDAVEKNDLAESMPELTAELRELAKQYLESRPAPWGVEAPMIEIDEMEANQLRALGYAVP